MAISRRPHRKSEQRGRSITALISFFRQINTPSCTDILLRHLNTHVARVLHQGSPAPRGRVLREPRTVSTYHKC